MSEHKLARHDALAPSYDAVKEYGFEACMEYNPREMARKRIDGTFVGPEGVQAMKEVESILIDRVKASKIDPRTKRPVQRLVRYIDNYQLTDDGLEPVDIWIEDVASMVSLGHTPKEIAEKLYKERVNLHEFVAVSSGKASRAIVDGWL
jgi:hypothetical protein